MKIDQKQLEFANLICKSGKKGLLSLLEDFVMPALTDPDLKRVLARKQLFFLNVEIMYLSKDEKDPVIGIVGRLVKDIHFVRDQVYTPGKGLVHNEGSLQSSPSAIFLLILNNHRLVLLKETPYAPSLSEFKQTFIHCIKQVRARVVNGLIEEKKASEKDKNVGEIRREVHALYPEMTLDLIPLSSTEDIIHFVNKFKVLKRLEIKFVETNDEFDHDDFYRKVRAQKDKLGADKTVLRHTNSKGLDKDEVVSSLEDSSSQGNQLVSMDGFDPEGDKLTGNNESFQLKRFVKNPGSSPQTAGLKMYHAFEKLASEEIIKIPERPNISDKILRIIARYFNGN